MTGGTGGNSRVVAAAIAQQIAELHTPTRSYDDYQFGWCRDCAHCGNQAPCPTSRLAASLLRSLSSPQPPERPEAATSETLPSVPREPEVKP